MAALSFLAALPPDEALAALRRRADACERAAGWACGGAMKATREAGLPRLFESEGEYEESQLAAELRFVKALVDEMADETLEGLEDVALLPHRRVQPQGGELHLRDAQGMTRGRVLHYVAPNRHNHEPDPGRPAPEAARKA